MASNCTRGVSIRRERVVRHKSWRNVWESQTLKRCEIDPRVVGRAFKRTFGDAGSAGSLRVVVKNDLGDINETEALSVL